MYIYLIQFEEFQFSQLYFHSIMKVYRLAGPCVVSLLRENCWLLGCVYHNLQVILALLLALFYHHSETPF